MLNRRVGRGVEPSSLEDLRHGVDAVAHNKTTFWIRGY